MYLARGELQLFKACSDIPELESGRLMRLVEGCVLGSPDTACIKFSRMPMCETDLGPEAVTLRAFRLRPAPEGASLSPWGVQLRCRCLRHAWGTNRDGTISHDPNELAEAGTLQSALASLPCKWLILPCMLQLAAE